MWLSNLTRMDEVTVELPPLQCNGCRACCMMEQIELHPEHGDDPSLYETVAVNGKIRFKPREDGKKSCRYLGANGCTIYEKRPITCRSFDCRVYMLAKLNQMGRNRAERRKLLSTSPWLAPIFAAARSRMRLENA